jgi:high-affinity Fe2+/Pb2+ permease
MNLFGSRRRDDHDELEGDRPRGALLGVLVAAFVAACIVRARMRYGLDAVNASLLGALLVTVLGLVVVGRLLHRRGRN